MGIRKLGAVRVKIEQKRLTPEIVIKMSVLVFLVGEHIMEPVEGRSREALEIFESWSPWRMGSHVEGPHESGRPLAADKLNSRRAGAERIRT